MSDLRLIGRSEDGSELELQSQDGTTHTLRISDQLRALVNQPRLVAVVPSDEETTVTVKEIQARLRSGESFDSIARTTQWSTEKVEKFSGPILQERAYVIGLALAAQLRREKYAPTLSAATIAQLSPRGVDMERVEWNTWRNPDGSWNIVLYYPTKDGSISEANWTFDLANRSLEALDDGAAWIAGDEIDSRHQTPSHGIVYPTTPVPRLVAVRENGDEKTASDTPRISGLDAIIDTGPSVSSEVSEAEKRDGITKRLKIPSWDDIMFGGSKGTSEEE